MQQATLWRMWTETCVSMCVPHKNWLPNFKTNSHCTITISCDCMCVYVCAYVHTHTSSTCMCRLRDRCRFIAHFKTKSLIIISYSTRFFCLQVAQPDEVDQIFLVSPNKEPTPPSSLHTTDMLWKIPHVLVAWTQLTLLLLQLIISLTCHACKLTLTCQVISNDDMPKCWSLNPLPH